MNSDKYVVGKTNMPGWEKVVSTQINRNGYGEIYFLKSMPMHKVRTSLNKLLSLIRDGAYFVIAVGVDSESVAEIADIDEDSKVYQWKGE